MNCYYSNLLEGHDTHPVDIERALQNDYSRDTRKRDLQLEARAHITVQQWIDGGAMKGGLAMQAEGISETHRRFCELAGRSFVGRRPGSVSASYRANGDSGMCKLAPMSLSARVRCPASSSGSRRCMGGLARPSPSLRRRRLIIGCPRPGTQRRKIQSAPGQLRSAAPKRSRWPRHSQRTSARGVYPVLSHRLYRPGELHGKPGATGSFACAHSAVGRGRNPPRATTSEIE